VRGRKCEKDGSQHGFPLIPDLEVPEAKDNPLVVLEPDRASPIAFDDAGIGVTTAVE
jgi:hypothetical protein